MKRIIITFSVFIIALGLLKICFDRTEAKISRTYERIMEDNSMAIVLDEDVPIDDYGEISFFLPEFEPLGSDEIISPIPCDLKVLTDSDFNIGPSPEWFILAEAGDDEYFFPKIRINKDYCKVVDIYDNYANNELVIELEKKEAK